jgi:hypothetical protein
MPVLRPELRLEKRFAIPAKVDAGFASGIAAVGISFAIPDVAVSRLYPDTRSPVRFPSIAFHAHIDIDCDLSS